ncbi:calcium-binding protein [Campylobacter rectus]|uniref:Haemolysin-type calcium binding-related domain-containing protein n=3 Tax=Campylobacter rectus TaxID=203 RepID=A0A6G5QMI5_CAMRE|nr:calcium-binding protein [Campylobacter rectus]QCD46807.1 hypothetical protein CRECT_1147 [Campylobacter rectus]UEB47512.1 hypothetical protein LK437_11025 [Campylobacter rectus]
MHNVTDASRGKSTLTVQKGDKSITINEFSKEDKSLGIKLANSKIEVSVTNKEGGDRWLQESLGDAGLPFTLSLNRKLDKGEYLKVEVVTSMKGDKSIIEFKEGEGDIGKDFNFTWEDDNYPQGNRSFVVNACVVDESSDLTAEVISSARGTIKDDDRDPDNPNNPNYPNNPDVPTDPNDPENAPVRYDPIIIDLNKDGTTTSKLNGAVNFDMDNNGFKEATGWISKDDAFLAYDRNGNGKIDNGSEYFEDIRKDEVEFSNQDGSGLNIKIKGTQDSISIKRWYSQSVNQIPFKFADGVTMSSQDLRLTVIGDESDNTLYGYQNNDTIEGGKSLGRIFF